jgi:AraC-like DNA-binding protein/ligand-binding sensor protein
MSKTPSASEADIKLLQPAFSLVQSFSNIVGVQTKFCQSDGQFLNDVPPAPAAGPCSVLITERGFSESCAASHADAIEIARSLRRPYIFTCHSRLAAWAIPIVRDVAPLPISVICGGALLIEPDAALDNHLRAIAEKQKIDPDELIRSLDDLPILPRDYFRTAAGFIFELVRIFAAQKSTDAPAAEPANKPTFPFFERPPLSLVFPPRQRKEPKREQARRSIERQTRNAEEEVVRLLREKRREEAFRKLLRLLRDDAGPRDSAFSHRDSAEIFTRLFRVLSSGRIDPDVHERQAALLRDALALKRGPACEKNLQYLCETFIAIAEELVGGPRPRKVKAIQRYVEKNLSKKLTLGTVGDKFGLKEKPLNALILKHYGMSFTDYVIALRVAEAKRLLKTTDLTLGEISLKTGFPDQSYFTKVFKATAGMTPSEYRGR